MDGSRMKMDGWFEKKDRWMDGLKRRTDGWMD